MRKLPWIAAQDRLKNRHGYDCGPCKSKISRDERRAYKCGWIPKSEWLHVPHSTWGACGGSHDVPEYCPGYTVRLPLVQEAARLWGWEKRGSLDVHLRARGYEPSPMLMDLVDIFAGEANAAEAWEMEQRTEKGRG